MTDEDALLELARMIRAEVDRIAADPSAHPDLLREVFDRADRDERARLARQVFDALDAAQQWHVIESLFTAAELRDHLRDIRLSPRPVTELDTAEIPAGEVLVLGLFREDAARAALTRGHHSTAAARRLELRAVGDGEFQVLADAFNPDRGYFVTRDYDESTWREEKLDSHEHVRVGSLTNESFQPVLHPGARVDFQRKEGSVRGRLFLGFAMLSGAGVFAP